MTATLFADPAVEIKFIVPAVPIAQPRQRTTIRGEGEKAFVHNYTPADHPVNAFKASVRHAARAAYQGPPLEGPIELIAWFIMPRPLSMIWKRRRMPRARHIKTPDRDNLEKSLKDALKGIVWRDDSQVCAGPVEKWIASGNEQPHVLVIIRQLGE